MRVVSISDKATKKLAALLADEVLRLKKSGSLVIALTGDLGSGKTTFIQGFIRAAGIKKRVTSPSFLIFKKYQMGNVKCQMSNVRCHFENIYHFDLYRLDKVHAAREVRKLGWQEIAAGPNIILVEWADKLRRLMAPGAIMIKFKHGKKQNQRIIEIKAKNS